MESKNRTSSTYSVLKFQNGKYRLVKFIGEYKSENEAYRDMLSILDKNKTEKQVEEDKWKNREIEEVYFESLKYTDL